MPSNSGAALQDVVDQTKIAALPDYGKIGGGSANEDVIASSGVQTFLEQPEKALKSGVRLQHGLSLQREERCQMCNTIGLSAS